MKTGEGKTLVATGPCYLNALEGKGVHVVTVNDYLARRDSEWMGRIYNFLGMSVGVVVHGLTEAERQRSYRSDITYGMNSELGFDYLRDNMKDSIERYVQRDLNYAVVDEVDSILVDEARTPLIISGPAEESADLYQRVNTVIPSLRKDIDFTVDEKAHSTMMTDSGVDRIEQKLGIGNLYDAENIPWLHHVSQALRAHALYKRDVNYLVEDGKIVIVDEFTGRKMPGRRWSDGLHQAIEAKEGVEIQEENQTLATISYQNFFRIYKKLSGMTGTADTEAEEFHKIYKLDVVVVPTNRGMQRADHHDVVYKNERGKFKAVVDEIEESHKRGQPVLVGTVSVEKSEVVASMLRKKNIPHNVLNAKQHEREAFIVAQAGKKGVRHHLDQHGRSWHRHHSRRKSRVPGARRGRSRKRREARARGRSRDSSRPRSSGSSRPVTPKNRRSSPPAACTSWAPNGTNPAASTTSCVAALAAKVTRAARASSFRWKTI